MRSCRQYIILLLLLLSGMIAAAQNPNNLIATRTQLVLLVDLNSPKNYLDSIFKKAAINNVNINNFIKGDFSVLTKDGWVEAKRQKNIVQFNRPLKDLKANPPENPFVVTNDIIKNEPRHGYMDNAAYGVNKFINVTVYELPSGLTRFNLPGYLNARRVFLSGGFNDWSTLKGKMTKTTTGWFIDIKLQPGGWMYKFIINSDWTLDPNNSIQMGDGGGNTNSVYYKYNYTFKLHGFSIAKKITLVGSFNSWKNNELIFEKKGDAWELPLYLSEGMHSYRFIIDGRSIPDPANPDKYKDSDGLLSSVLNIGETVYFKLNGYTNAKNVYVAGSFNSWEQGKISMKKTTDGWSVPLILPAGNYDYKFIVDGEWITDPQNPVSDVESKQLNSFIAVKPNHTFNLIGYSSAKTVILSGSFNNWKQNGYRLGNNGSQWSISLHLEPGKCLYKFIVDDKWILDPGNKQWEQNQFGTGNSVLWIDR